MNKENDCWEVSLVEPVAKLGVFRLHTEAIVPGFQTKGAAAADIHLMLTGESVETWSPQNAKFKEFPQFGENGFLELHLRPGFRYKLPTGLVFDIPEGYWMSVNLRGGTALKKGLSLTNSTGIIDWDYTDETFVCVINTSEHIVVLENKERIAQVKLEKCIPTEVVVITDCPGQKTDRTGGFNSTGIK